MRLRQKAVAGDRAQRQLDAARREVERDVEGRQAGAEHQDRLPGLARRRASRGSTGPARSAPRRRTRRPRPAGRRASSSRGRARPGRPRAGSRRRSSASRSLRRARRPALLRRRARGLPPGSSLSASRRKCSRYSPYRRRDTKLPECTEASRSRAQRRKWSGSSGRPLIPPAATFRTCASMRVRYATPRPTGPNRLTSVTRTGRPRRRSWAATATPLKPPPMTAILDPSSLNASRARVPP